MVTGFTKFKERFRGFENQFVVIGGTAGIRGRNKEKIIELLFKCYGIL